MGAMEAQALVVLTGPPGAGKTTVAGRLLDHAPLAVHLHGDDFWHYIKRGFVAPFLAGSERQNEVVTAALGAAAAEYAAGGYLTVLETIVGPWLLRLAIAAATRRRIAVNYVVLRPSADVARARAAARRSRELREPVAVDKMYDAFTSLGPFERYVIDSSVQTPDETAADVLERLQDGTAVLDLALLPDRA